MPQGKSRHLTIRRYCLIEHYNFDGRSEVIVAGAQINNQKKAPITRGFRLIIYMRIRDACIRRQLGE